MAQVKSNRERVIELASPPHNMEPEAIAERLDMKIGTVRSYVSTARGQGRVPAIKPEGNKFFTVKLPESVACDIQERAENMGVTCDALMAKLLTYIARDDMFGAVLDEG
jgi:hypothetical protein